MPITRNEWLRRWIRTGLKQREIARRMGVDESWLSRWVKDEPISHHHWSNLCRTIRVLRDELATPARKDVRP